MTIVRIRGTIVWVVVGVVVGSSSSARLNAATDNGCLPEFIELNTPVVRVIDGPGSVDLERTRWLEYNIEVDDERTYAYFDGQDIGVETDDWSVLLVLERIQ